MADGIILLRIKERVLSFDDGDQPEIQTPDFHSKLNTSTPPCHMADAMTAKMDDGKRSCSCATILMSDDKPLET